MAYDVNKLPRLKHLRDLAERLQTKVTDLEDKVEELVTEGGEPNVITSIQVNGTAQTITNKTVDITVPTKVSDLTNDSGYQTAQDVENTIKAQVGSAYQAGGSVDPDNLPELTEENIGLVVNVTDPFMTDTDFLEGAGNEYPAGTNIVIVKQGDDIKYDVLSGFVDLSNYVTKDELSSELPEPYTLPVATNTVLGGIKVNKIIDVEPNYSYYSPFLINLARLSNSDFAYAEAKPASETEYGIICVGSGLVSDEGVVSVDIATDAEVTEMLDAIFPPTTP